MIARVNTSTSGTGAGAAASLQTPAAPLAAGNLAVAVVRTSHPVAVSSVIDTAGNTYALVPNAYTGADPHLYFYYAENCLGHATNQVTVTITGTQTFWWIFALQYAGVLSSGSLGATPAAVHDTTAVTSIAVGGITTGANELILLAASYNTISTFAAGSDFTLVDGLIGGGGNTFGGIEEYVAPTALSGYTARITGDVSGVPFADSAVAVSFRGLDVGPAVLGPQALGGRFHL